MEKQIKTQIEREYYQNVQIAKLNEFYVMPISVYNEILNRLGHINDYLLQDRKGRDNWKKRYMEIKNKENNN